MIVSMTGYGKAMCLFRDQKLLVEIRSLNSKILDLNIKLPVAIKDKENRIRNLLSSFCERGKIDFFVVVENSGLSSNITFNQKLIRHYFDEISAIGKQLNIVASEKILASLLRLPDVMQTNDQPLADDEWEIIDATIIQAISQLNQYRISEGQNLHTEILNRLRLIENLLSETTHFEEKRIQTIKQRIIKSVTNIADTLKIDENRFEQELFYYIERMDITEEKVRLKRHIDYFAETIDENSATGKKLGFIAQEIGREINTIGSKANDADIQKIVVQMKDELEKIKEQLMNVL